MDQTTIDAGNQIVGRLASKIAKDLLNGKSITVVNAIGAVISGDPVYTIALYREKVARGDPYHGPFFPSSPERIIKRTVRGMLPKNHRGRDALKRLTVYNTVPDHLRGTAPATPDAQNRRKQKYITLAQLSQKIGGKVTW